MVLMQLHLGCDNKSHKLVHSTSSLSGYISLSSLTPYIVLQFSSHSVDTNVGSDSHT
jgi:hypothetical protein